MILRNAGPPIEPPPPPFLRVLDHDVDRKRGSSAGAKPAKETVNVPS